jgi:hypothetical protein
VVKLIVGIEACSCSLPIPPGCIGRIDKKCGGLLRGILPDYLYAVTLTKCDLVSNVLDIGDTFA